MPRVRCVWAKVRLSVSSSVANTPFTLVLHRSRLICSRLSLDLGCNKGGGFVADGVENLFKLGFCNILDGNECKDITVFIAFRTY